MKIVIEVIPHEEQRYDTVGDWLWSADGQTLYIRVSELTEEGNMNFEFLVAIHEAVEAWACGNADISSRDVDKFDMTWKPHDGILEPGDDPKAPYHQQHKLASEIERQVAAGLGVDWAEYEQAVDNA